MPVRLLMAILAAAAAATLARAASVEAQAERTIIRTLDFEDASPREIFEFLREQSRTADPDGKGINMLFRLSPAGLKVFAQPCLTLKMHNVPLSAVVNYVCLATGLLHSYDANALMVYDRASGQPMETRAYGIRAGVLDSSRTRDRLRRVEALGDSGDDRGNSRD